MKTDTQAQTQAHKMLAAILDPEAKAGPARLASIRTAARAAKAMGRYVSLADVALAVRAVYAKHRRFPGVCYLSTNTSVRSVLSDAFAEVILGEDRHVTSWCSKWQRSKESVRHQQETEREWAEALGVYL